MTDTLVADVSERETGCRERQTDRDTWTQRQAGRQTKQTDKTDRQRDLSIALFLFQVPLLPVSSCMPTGKFCELIILIFAEEKTQTLERALSIIDL